MRPCWVSGPTKEGFGRPTSCTWTWWARTPSIRLWRTGVVARPIVPRRRLRRVVLPGQWSGQRAASASGGLATALLLQTHDKVSDAEAKARVDFDIRWKVALGIEIEDRPFAKSTFQVFRAQLILQTRWVRCSSRACGWRGRPAT